MTDFETFEAQDRIGRLFERAIDEATNGSDRSRQAMANVLGVSDIGMCHEYVRRVITNEEPSQVVHRYDLAAFIGTAIGDHVEDAVIAAEVDWLDHDWHKQTEVKVRLTVRGYELEILGHPDLYSTPSDELVDVKTKDGLGVVRRQGRTDQQRFQLALYAKALIDEGKLTEDCWLHNVWIDRSGQDTKPYVISTRFSWAEVEEAIAWLDDVMYAVQMGEEAYRDPPREFCWAACPFAPQCRGIEDSDVQGKITDPEVVEAIKVYEDAKEQIKALEKDKKSAESVLRGVSGSTDDFTIRWVDIPGGHVAYDRSAYQRLDLKPVRRRPRK